MTTVFKATHLKETSHFGLYTGCGGDCGGGGGGGYIPDITVYAGTCFPLTIFL